MLPIFVFKKITKYFFLKIWMKNWFKYLFLKYSFRYFILLLQLFLEIKILKNHLSLKLFRIGFHKNHFWYAYFWKFVLSLKSIFVDLAKCLRKVCHIFNVNFEKAYDSASWSFLDYMLTRFGFSNKWRSWVRGCVCLIFNLIVLINGSPTQ